MFSVLRGGPSCRWSGGGRGRGAAGRRSAQAGEAGLVLRVPNLRLCVSLSNADSQASPRPSQKVTPVILTVGMGLGAALGEGAELGERAGLAQKSSLRAPALAALTTTSFSFSPLSKDVCVLDWQQLCPSPHPCPHPSTAVLPQPLGTQQFATVLEEGSSRGQEPPPTRGGSSSLTYPKTPGHCSHCARRPTHLVHSPSSFQAFPRFGIALSPTAQSLPRASARSSDHSGGAGDRERLPFALTASAPWRPPAERKHTVRGSRALSRLQPLLP